MTLLNWRFSVSIEPRLVPIRFLLKLCLPPLPMFSLLVLRLLMADMSLKALLV